MRSMRLLVGSVRYSFLKCWSSLVLGAARRAELISVVDCSSRVKESKAGGELILIVSLKGKRIGNECRPVLEAWVTPRLARMSARSLPSRPPYTTKGYFQGALLGILPVVWESSPHLA